MIRNPDHVADMRQVGAEAVVCDLEAASAGDVAARLSGADAVVFAVGAGPGSGAPRKDSVDRAGICRFVQVSSMGAAGPPAPLAQSPAPTSPWSLPPCSKNRVLGTRRSS